MLELNKIYNEDLRIGMLKLPYESVDLIVVSPVYKDKDGFTWDLMDRFLDESYRVLKKNSLIFINFGSLAEDKLRPFKLAIKAEQFGFILQETIIWWKNGHYTPINGKKRVNNLHEYVFMLYKGEMPDLDRLSIGIPYADPANAKRWGNKTGLKCKGTVWPIKYDTVQKSSQKLHPDVFPLELPLNCIKLSGIKPGSLVLDPFSGSGSTCLAAKQLGMQYLGFEINLKHVKTAEERLK